MTRKAAITGVAHFVPETVLSNEELEAMVDTSNQWIIERSGIRERRILRDPLKATVHMAVRAAKKLLEKKKLSPLELDLIILATVTPDLQFPASANLVAHELGATRAWGFDMNAACSSFLYALQTASKFIETGTHQKILVIGADKMSSIVDYTDRGTCVLFGDGAGCVLLEPDHSGNGILDADLHTDGSGAPLLYQKAGGSLHPASLQTIQNREHYIRMDGKGVFKLAVVRFGETVATILKRNQLQPADIAFFVPHQANKRIIMAALEQTGISEAQTMINIDRYGNTTSATLPICLSEWENELKKGDKLILATFGAGFTWGSIYLKWAY